MSDEPDEPFYSPKWNPPRARKPTPGEPLWRFQKNHVTWSCKLRFHSESFGWEAQILREGELFMARGAFVTKAGAIRWAEEERKDVEREFVEDL